MKRFKRQNNINKNSFMKSVVLLLCAQVIIKILGFVYKMYLTNKEGFGDEGNAIYSSGFQIYVLLLTISCIGVPNAVSKLVSERVSIGDFKGAHKIFKIGIIIFGFIGGVSSILLLNGAEYIANSILHIPEAKMSLVALAPSIFFVSIICVVKGYFNGRECINVTANSQTLEQIFKTILTIGIVEIIIFYNGLNTTVMAAGANLATTISSIICLGYLYIYYIRVRKQIYTEIKKNKNYKYIKTKDIIKNIFSQSIPMSFTPVLATLNKNIDSVTVVRGLKKFMSDVNAKAEYGILSGKVDTLITLPMSFNIAFITALIPAVAAAKSRNNIKGIVKRIEFTILVTILIGLPCTVAIVTFAENILNLLFKNQSEGTLILQISAISIIFIVIEQTTSGVLQGLGKSFMPAIALGIGVIVKLILNLLLVPLNSELYLFGGVAGAALATTVCHMIACFIDVCMLNKYIKLEINILNYIIKPILSSISMVVVMITCNMYLTEFIDESFSTIISLIIAFVVYLLLIILFKVFNKDNILMIPFGNNVYSFLEKLRIY